YLYDLRLATRRANLARVNEQLQYFYGPLYSNLMLELDLFGEFKEEDSLGDGFWQNFGDNPKSEQAEAWRKWMIDVFMPINERNLRLVTERADLIEEVELPKSLRLLNLHVTSYKILHDRWRSDDFSRHLPKVFFPSQINEYAADHYSRLKKEQARLLGQKI
ncbi:MAG: hypothetical protein V3T49_02235, partial [Dehalococcoidia bacterium]